MEISMNLIIPHKYTSTAVKRAYHRIAGCSCYTGANNVSMRINKCNVSNARENISYSHKLKKLRVFERFLQNTVFIQSRCQKNNCCQNFSLFILIIFTRMF